MLFIFHMNLGRGFQFWCHTHEWPLIRFLYYFNSSVYIISNHVPALFQFRFECYACIHGFRSGLCIVLALMSYIYTGLLISSLYYFNSDFDTEYEYELWSYVLTNSIPILIMHIYSCNPSYVFLYFRIHLESRHTFMFLMSARFLIIFTWLVSSCDCISLCKSLSSSSINRQWYTMFLANSYQDAWM